MYTVIYCHIDITIIRYAPKTITRFEHKAYFWYRRYYRTVFVSNKFEKIICFSIQIWF